MHVMVDIIFDWWLKNNFKVEEVTNKQQHDWQFTCEKFVRNWSVGICDDGNDYGKLKFTW